MKKERFFELMAQIDDDLILRAERTDIPNKKRTKILRFGALAACFCLIATIFLMPRQSNANYSASDIAALFSAANDAFATNAYTKVYAPSGEYLSLSELPDDNDLAIYQLKRSQLPLNRTNFEENADIFLSRLAEALRGKAPGYEIEKYDLPVECLHMSASISTATVWMEQTTFDSVFCFYTNGLPLYLNGNAIKVDPCLSDDEIIASLAAQKEELFAVFGASFGDVKVVRKYNSYFRDGVSGSTVNYLSVYFYNEDDHALNRTQEVPVSDYIVIDFDGDGDNADGFLTKASVSYRQSRNSQTYHYDIIASKKRISLKQAEALLYKGYVFGGHSCPLCMAAQDKVSFDGYDFVDIEYVFEYNSDRYAPRKVIPFYAFYKQIGVCSNGNLIYAKTYVPAIEVDGYEEYFQGQMKNHR